MLKGRIISTKEVVQLLKEKKLTWEVKVISTKEIKEVKKDNLVIYK